MTTPWAAGRGVFNRLREFRALGARKLGAIAARAARRPMSSRSQASAWLTMVERSAKRGCHFSVFTDLRGVRHDLAGIALPPRRVFDLEINA